VGASGAGRIFGLGRTCLRVSVDSTGFADVVGVKRTAGTAGIAGVVGVADAYGGATSVGVSE
jgi:hypothetical protein